ncbi:MAG: hypothetical protein HRF42_05045 [Candidatus Brocadia sp.]
MGKKVKFGRICILISPQGAVTDANGQTVFTNTAYETGKSIIPAGQAD